MRLGITSGVRLWLQREGTDAKLDRSKQPIAKRSGVGGGTVTLDGNILLMSSKFLLHKGRGGGNLQKESPGYSLSFQDNIHCKRGTLNPPLKSHWSGRSS